MSGLGEVGISPVLLQAISHTLTSASESASTDRKLSTMNIKNENTSPTKVVSHLLQGMNEPIASLIQPNSGDNIAVKSEKVELPSPAKNEQQNVEPGTQDMSIVNVLTALATQHLQKTNADAIQVSQSNVVVEQQHQQQHQHQQSTQIPVQATNEQGQHIIIYYNSESSTISTNPTENEVVIENVDGTGNGQEIRLVMEPSTNIEEVVSSSAPPSLPGLPALPSTSSPKPMYLVQGYPNDSQSTSRPPTVDLEPIGNPCPICGDKISGYHYGIYTCESCKGFFKRTVQNNKSFVCHRNTDCEVNVFNRKKCPACRFNRCLSMGMRLAAIRRDRTRGGRSSYEGCLTPKKPTQLERKLKRSLSGIKPPDDVTLPVSITVSGSDTNRSHLVAILNHSNPMHQIYHEGSGPQTPELLNDIMNLEPLLTDEDIAQDDLVDGMETQESLLNYLTQLTELRLYKLVRWARNLPQFGAISTDDQILLLQSCWSDLLALGVCWRSMEDPSCLRISATKIIGLDFATSMGFQEVVTRLLSLSEHFHNLKMDQVEYVALKVLLLITPDVKGVKDPAKVSEHQDKLMEALEIYTSSHSPRSPNKFGEMLLRLPELARVSFIAKELLLNRLPKDTTTCGLLVELLKGENAAKDV